MDHSGSFFAFGYLAEDVIAARLLDASAGGDCVRATVRFTRWWASQAPHREFVVFA
jgi:hypothetical protein